jgi:hypothetical protein
VSTREIAKRLLDELPDSEIEPVVEFIVSRREGGNVDAWGDLDAQTDAFFTDSMKELAKEERAAGFGPWERETRS